MKVEFLVSTMHQSDLSIVKKMNILSNALLINQNDKNNNVIESDVNAYKIKMISVVDRGLSKSRNLALENASADYCMLADDDVVYYNNAHKIIARCHDKYPEYDIIAFNIKNFKDRFLKKNKCVKINWLTAMKLSSVQLSFKLQSIKKNKIRFNKDFGAGAKYICGEENIFLNDCLKAGLKILYVPKTLGELTESESTWFNGFNEVFFRSKGAIFTALSRRMSLILILQFVLRKHNEYKNDMDLISAMKFMLAGRREYLKNNKNNKKRS